MLQKFGFGNMFISLIKILFMDQDSCTIITAGKTNKYFTPKRGTRKGAQISTYLFMLVPEIVFLSLKQNKDIKNIDIENQEIKK